MGERDTKGEVPEGVAALPFGARLRSMRRAAGLTQEELASRAGLSPNAVGTLERGARRRPQPHTVRALSDALNLPEGERAALLASVPERGGPTPPAERHRSASPVVPALPRPPTPLVGREREIAEVRGLLTQRNARLLTLTGIGGVGKTRLAAEVAREAGGNFPDGTAFVGLASLSDAALLVPTVLRSLGAPEAQGRTPLESLVDHLRSEHFLLVLDNLEHLLEAATEVAVLIEGCPKLVVLATSRAPLRVKGEQEYPIPPLALPASTRAPSEEGVLASASGMLFAERARAASPGFKLTPENAASVAAICWRLAGLPLALELAAAKARFLDPATLLSRLDQALSTAWARDLPERQRTMRATLDWSFGLLGEPERSLLGRLSVFVGGFSLPAAEAVGAGPDAVGNAGGEDVIDHLGTLVEQSLVTVDPDAGGEARYGMLEPVRQYAREKLEQSGEAQGVLREHAAFFLALSRRAGSGMWGPRQGEWLERLDRENGNLQAAIGWALGAGEAATAARFGWMLNSFWFLRGYHREGRRWAEATLEGPLPPKLRARAHHAAAAMAFAQGDYPAAEGGWQETLRLSQSEGDILAEAYAWGGLGIIVMVRSDFELAASRMEKALSLLERYDEDPPPEGQDYEDPTSVVSVTRVFLGTTMLARGDLGGAQRMFEEGLEVARRTDNPMATYVGLYNLAQLALTRDDLELASRTLEEGIDLSGRTKDRANLAHFLDALAAVAAFRDEAKRSATLLGAAEALLEEVGARVHNYYAPDPSLRERAIAEARAGLGATAFEEAWEWGRGMSFDRAVEYALGVDTERPI